MQYQYSVGNDSQLKRKSGRDRMDNGSVIIDVPHVVVDATAGEVVGECGCTASRRSS